MVPIFFGSGSGFCSDPDLNSGKLSDPDPDEMIPIRNNSVFFFFIFVPIRTVRVTFSSHVCQIIRKSSLNFSTVLEHHWRGFFLSLSLLVN